MPSPIAASRTPTRRLAASLIVVAATAVAAATSGCGSSSADTAATSAQKSASPGEMTRTCPAKSRGSSVTVPAAVRNDLAIPVQLWFDDIDCSRWWGKTPAYYSGAILAPGASIPMPVAVWSGGAPEWNTKIRSQDGADVYAAFRQILTWGRRIDILIGTSYSRENTIPMSGAGKPAIARVTTGNTLVLAYTKK